jgi:hypothetical protein
MAKPLVEIFSGAGETWRMGLGGVWRAAPRTPVGVSHFTSIGACPASLAFFEDRVASMKEEFHTALYWRNRADEARALSDQLSNKDARASMERVAQMYEDLAARTAEREGRSSFQPE